MINRPYMIETTTTLRRGNTYPLGAPLNEDGVNYSLLSENAATTVVLFP